jgi:hypothetical protein
MADIQANFFQPFKDVTSLIITHQTAQFAKYHWPICWKKYLGAGFLKRKSEILFPKLVNLQVDFPNVLAWCIPLTKDLEELFAELIREIELFLLARKRLGHPIRSLRLNHVPGFLRARVDRLTRVVDRFEVSRNSNEPYMDAAHWLC